MKVGRSHEQVTTENKERLGIKSRTPKWSLRFRPEKPGASVAHPAGVPGEPPEGPFRVVGG